jgi:hypothetical protein
VAFPYTAEAADARLMAMHRLVANDPTSYPKPGDKRWDAKFGAVPLWNEVLNIVESESVGRRVRVKNATGATFVKGTLVHPETAKLSPQATATAVNNPLAGAGVVINVSATFEVGELVKVESLGNIDVGIATAVSAGVSVTVDILFHDHETPTVTSLAAYEITKSDADGALPAEWVLPAAIAAGEYGWAYDCCEVTGLDTSAFTIEAMLYLSSTAGEYTATAPTGGDQIQHAVGIVKKAHASTGIVLFFPGLKRILKYGSSFFQSGLVLTDGDKGDITVSASGATWTIDAGVVTLAKMANIATDRLIGRDTAGTGVPEAISVSGGIEFTGSTGIQTSAFTGDVTKTAGGTALTIASDAVTNAKAANMAALTVKVNATNSSADPSDLAFSADGDMLMRIGTTLTTGNFSSLTAIDVALDDAIPLSDTSASNANKKISVDRLLGSSRHLCEGRLTLTSGTAVTTSDVIGATNIYFALYNGNKVRLYDGTRWKVYTFTERTLALGALTNDLPYDVFLYDNAGTLTLEATAWTSKTGRATAITTQDGVYVKSGATTRLWLGTFHTTGTGTTTEDSKARRLVINHYNKVQRKFSAFDGQNSWNTTASAYEAWGTGGSGSTTDGVTRVAILCPSPAVDDMVVAEFHGWGSHSSAGNPAGVGIGVDSSTVNSAGIIVPEISATAGTQGVAMAAYKDYPSLGYHYLQMLQRPFGATTSFYGDNNGDYLKSAMEGFVLG